MKIAVYGSAAGDIPEKVRELAREIGRQIALRGHILITGGCPGLPYEAVLGANEMNGRVIGFSPAVNEDNHIHQFRFPLEGFSKLMFVPDNYQFVDNKKACLKYRNISSVVYCDCAVIISGRCGTINELTIAYDLGKNIGVLSGTGGISKFIKTLIDDWNKPTSSHIIYESNPKKLIVRLEEITK